MSELHVMPAPRHVDIAITGRCNLACRYCFYADEMVARSDLPTERWLAFFEELGRLGVMTVCLTGGEVFTRPDLFELIDGIIANRMRYQILSNGTLITEKVLSQFEVGKRRLRLDSIQVSVDGSRAEIHDRSRPNSFARVVRGLRLLTEANFPVTVRVTVNCYNVDDLENTARLLLEEIGLPGFSTNDAYACGATNRAEQGIMLSPTQRQKAMQMLTQLVARYDGRISAQAGPLALAREFERIETALAAGQTGFPGRGTLCGCGGVFSKIAILHDGTIVPCHNLSTLRLGSIGVDDLRQVWLEHPLLNAVRQRQEIPLNSLDTCRGCAYQGFCTGGCPGGAVFLVGELNARNPLDCYRVLKGEDPYYTLDVAVAEASRGGESTRSA
jgi:SynChlorMet cassette radical SAM/SPASM protein ScmE